MPRNGNPRFEILRGRRGGYYWRLRARNGKIIADGSEQYANRSNAIRALRRVVDLVLEHGHLFNITARQI